VKYGEQVGENEARVENAGRETDTYSYKLPESIRQNAQLIDEKLANIKVCDPAIGSGAFPVGMMSEIVKTRNVLSVFIKDKDRTIYNFKRECIEKSLYGVDIDPGAVEIAKLRLWLSLVVDEDDIREIKPLPNLDYKIVCGNSLLGYPYKPQGLKEIEKLKADFFSETNPKKKQLLKNEIDAAIYDLYKNTEKNLGYKVNFDFRINFSEIFHESNDGFDVVIANPPYVQMQNDHGKLADQYKKCGYAVFSRTGDIYCLFYERGQQILKKTGHLTYITSNKWMRAKYGEKLRKFFISKTNLLQLIDFGDSRIFENATTYTNIMILSPAGKGTPEVYDLSRVWTAESSFDQMLREHYNVSVQFGQNRV